MSRTVEAPHDLDRCPVCRNEIDPEALLCAACGAEKITINDGTGGSAQSLGCAGALLIPVGLVSSCVGLTGDNYPEQALMPYVHVAVSLGALALGIKFLMSSSRQGQENIEKTTRPAWKHVSASDVIAAHKRAEEAAEEAARAADSAARAARKSAKRSFWDQLDKDNR